MRSECCGTLSYSSIEDGISICSECKEWSEFEEDEEEFYLEHDHEPVRVKQE